MKHATYDFMIRVKTHTHPQSLSLGSKSSIIFMIFYAILLIP